MLQCRWYHLGKIYEANLTYADGTEAIVDLPKADNEGITLMVNNNPDKLRAEHINL